MLNFCIRHTLLCLRIIRPRVARTMHQGLKYIGRQSIADKAHSLRGSVKQFSYSQPPGVSSNIPRELVLLLPTLFAASKEGEGLDGDKDINFIPIPETTSMLTVKKVEDFEDQIYNAGDKLVILFIMVRWCPFCRKILPTVEEIASRAPEKVVVLKLDMDDQEAESSKIVARYEAFYFQKEKYAVNLPTFVFMKEGSKLEQFSSADDQKLRGTVDKYTEVKKRK